MLEWGANFSLPSPAPPRVGSSFLPTLAWIAYVAKNKGVNFCISFLCKVNWKSKTHFSNVTLELVVHQFSSVFCHCRRAEEAGTYIWMGINEKRQRRGGGGRGERERERERMMHLCLYMFSQGLKYLRNYRGWSLYFTSLDSGRRPAQVWNVTLLDI